MFVNDVQAADATDRIAELVAQGQNRNQLEQSDFLALMIAQLQNQDPLAPITDQEFIGQITQFNILEEVGDFNAALSGLQAFQATGLIGQRVEGVLDGGELVGGTVVEVLLLNGTATLVLDTGQTLSLDRVVRVLPSPEPASAAKPAP